MSLYDHIRRSNRSRKACLMYPKYEPNDYVCKPNLSGEMFDEILTIYENNQRYYAINGMMRELNDFEYWFIHVIEPEPVSNDAEVRMAWMERENHKIRGYSYYCPDVCRKLVNISGRDFSTVSRHIRRMRAAK